MAYDSLNALQIAGYDVSQTAPVNGQSLVYDGSSYVPTNVLLNTDNTVLIRSESDFPDPVGGVISLEAKKYIIVGNVTHANKLKPPSTGTCSIEGDNFSGSSLTYTGSGTQFENTSFGSAIFVGTQIIFSSPSGTMFNIDGDSTGFLFFRDIIISDSSSLGTIKDISATIRVAIIQDVGQGIVFDNIPDLTFSSNRLKGWKNESGSVMVTIQNASDDLQLANNFFVPAGSNETIFDIKAASTSNSAACSGNTVNLVNGGTTFAAGSKTQASVDWDFVNNPPGIPNSTVTAEAFFTGPATTTIIAQNAWMIANMSGVTSDGVERISVGSDGVLQYLGLRQDRVVLNGTTNMETDLGVNQDLEARYVVIPPTDTSCTFTNATNTINAIGHGRVNGDIITFKNTAGTLPAELQDDIFYYVVNKADDTFQVSYTLGGAAVAFTDDGSGSNSYEVAEFIGEAGSATVGTNAPADFKPTANSCALETNSEIVLAVRTKTTPLNDIVINTSYIRLNKI